MIPNGMIGPYGIIKDWRDDIKIGDVLYERGDPNKPRIVRNVSRNYMDNRFVGCITFSILHCSWTQRCYTVLSRTDLAQRGFTPARVRVTRMTLIDKRIAAEIAARRNWTASHLTCCDVKGIR